MDNMEEEAINQEPPVFHLPSPPGPFNNEDSIIIEMESTGDSSSGATEHEDNKKEDDSSCGPALPKDPSASHQMHEMYLQKAAALWPPAPSATALSRPPVARPLP